MTLDAYLSLSGDARERARVARVPVLDADGNVLPRCDGCGWVVAGWSPWYAAGCVDRPSGLFFCGECAAERNLT